MAVSGEGTGQGGTRESAEMMRSFSEATAAGGRDASLFVPHVETGALRSVLTEGMAAVSADIRPSYESMIESICGATDDSQAVELYNGTLGVSRDFVRANQRPVAQVQWNDNLASRYTNPGDVSGVRWGSGTMISPHLFLTCGHLFDQTGGGWQRPLQNGTTNVISPQEIATNMHLNFHYQVDGAGTLRREHRFPILELLEYRLGGVDFAVCRIGRAPGYAFGWTDLAGADAAVNDMLCIMGHPLGVPKRIEAGPTTALSGNQIRYNDIDTLGGNSGSGVLRAGRAQIVGVHTNGGCTESGGFNFGMRISSVRSNSPIVARHRNPRRQVVAVDSWGSNRLDIFGLGTDNSMFHKAWAGAWHPSQTGWEPLGGIFNSAPAVVSWAANRLDIFGLGTDNSMFHKAWEGRWHPSQTGWEALGGIFNSPPAVVAWGPNRLDIFGLGTDNQMFHKAWDGSRWHPSQTGWEALGGIFNSPPAVVAWGPNRLDIFGLGTDNQMFHKAWNGAWHPSQTGWEALGGIFNSPPAVVAWGTNRLDIFGLGTDNQMFHKAWNGAWHPSLTGWEPLGGIFNRP